LKSKENEKVGLIAAAGMSVRLSNIGNNTIKEMIEYKGKPIICNCIDSLVKAQVASIIIVVRLGKEILVEFIKKRYPNIKIKFVYQSGEIGNLIDAIKVAYNEIKNKEVFFRLGDTYISPNPFIKTDNNRDKSVTLYCFHYNFNPQNNVHSNYGTIDIKNNIVIDKPHKYISNICWGAISWKEEFTEKIVSETDFTDVINKSNFNYFENISKFIDIGNELVKKYLSRNST